MQTTSSPEKPSTAVKTMKAVQIHAYGGSDVLQFEDAPKPKAAAGEVLVKVYAAAINPVDWKIREGYMKEMRKISFPFILGWDLSGVVEDAGAGVTRFKKGDEVISRPDLSRNGAYAEYIVIKASEVAMKPKSVDHEHAAGLSLAGLTAWQALFDVGGVQPGQTVLIHAAAGGVGSFAVQLAKWKGARVIGTASGENQSYLKKIGVDQPIDYKKQKFEDVAHDVDMVFDTLGGETQTRSWKVLKKGGILVSSVGQPPADQATKFGVRGVGIFAQTKPEQLEQLGALVDAGKLKITVSSVLPLSNARKAHDQSQSNHGRGKIILHIA